MGSQKAYRLTVKLLDRNGLDGTVHWQSGIMQSERTYDISYSGKPFASFSVYSWEVTVFSEAYPDGVTSRPAYFETAAISPGDIKAQWITDSDPVSYHAGSWESGTPNEKSSREEALHYCGIYLTKTFPLNSGHTPDQIVRARAYVTGVGLYTLLINGSPIGEQLLSPAQTDYRKRVHYDSLSWESAAKQENTATLLLGNGRHIALYGFGKPRGIVQLLIEYSDGTEQVVCSDETWQTAEGPIRKNSLFDGEVYRADVPIAGKKRKVQAVSGYPLQAAPLPPITVDKRIRPARMWKSSRGYIFDFGQNFAGFVEIAVRQPKHTELTIRHAELIDKRGELNPASNRGAAARDSYVCSGEGLETWHPSFTYHGFRYAELIGYIGVPDLSVLTGLFIHSGTDQAGLDQAGTAHAGANQAGSFICSHEDINQVHQAILWGQLSNCMGVPTDSPQRDERHGWLGDALLSADEAMFNFSLAGFYEKFLQDIADTQNPDGSITDVAPKFWMQKPADPAWGSAFISIGWKLYWYYGITTILERMFPFWQRYIDFLSSQAENGIIENLGTFGDWCAPGLVASKKTGLACISTWYYLHDVRLMAEIAAVIGRTDQADRYAEMADGIEERFLSRFWKDDHVESTPLSPWDAPDQTSQALVLAAEMLPEDKHLRLAAFLAKLAEKESGEHVGTGIHGTRYLLEVLSETGFHETAWDIAVQESYPGWIYMLRNGATTLWERWEYIASDGMNSHNHIMLGSVDGWYYQFLAGIRPSAPAWKQISCRPGMFSGLTFAHAAVSTPGGRAELGWERSEDLLKISVTIPPGSEGLLYLPEGYADAASDDIDLRQAEHEAELGGDRGDGIGDEHENSKGEQKRTVYILEPGTCYITCRKQKDRN